MGYDDNSLEIIPVNPLELSLISGTEALHGSFTWNWLRYNNVYHKEDRYVSFYLNGSYMFDDRYSITVSMRIDQSNLFGTDPKYQYRPLWSVGGLWHMTSEKFMHNAGWTDRLNLRLTYGIGGNVPKDAGPYLTLSSAGYNNWVNDVSLSISNPPNDKLRWEKTATTNLGIDFMVLNRCLDGSIDLYHKKTTDLLGTRNVDPTLGWGQLMLNYGSMTNKGIELSLRSTNIDTRHFRWGTNLTFSYNQNKLTNLDGTDELVFYYTAYNVAAIGRPLNSLYSYRYAGLDPNDGSVMVYNKDNEKVKDIDSVDELVYSGTRTPKWTGSIINTLSYKNFDLSFQFICYGGHVLRDVVAGYLSGAPGVNRHRKVLNRWRKPGDEKIPGIAPAFNRDMAYDYYAAQAWYSADAHVKKANYIKFRDISLTCNLPQKWLRPIAIESASVACQIKDIWWSAASGDVNPEDYYVSGYGRGDLTMPTPITYTVGLTVNF